MSFPCWRLWKSVFMRTAAYSSCSFPLDVHLGEELLFLDWSQADSDGDPCLPEVPLGSNEEKNSERAGLVLKAVVEGEDWEDLCFTEPC